jgi:hypothetical protein
MHWMHHVAVGCFPGPSTNPKSSLFDFFLLRRLFSNAVSRFRCQRALAPTFLHLRFARQRNRRVMTFDGRCSSLVDSATVDGLQSAFMTRGKGGEGSVTSRQHRFHGPFSQQPKEGHGGHPFPQRSTSRTSPAGSPSERTHSVRFGSDV